MAYQICKSLGFAQMLREGGGWGGEHFLGLEEAMHRNI